MTPQEIKQVRVNLKLSQQKMAEYLGLKHGRTIRAWEAGERPVPMWAAKHLAWLQVKIDNLEN